MALFQVTRSCWCSTGRPGGAHEFNLGFLGLGPVIVAIYIHVLWLIHDFCVKRGLETKLDFKISIKKENTKNIL